MRPNSQRNRSNSAQKPAFQTKFKSRLGGHLDLTHLNESVDSGKFSQTQRSGYNHENCLQQ